MAEDSGCEMSIDSQLSRHQTEDLPSSTSKLQTPPKTEYFDIVLICSSKAVQQRKQFMDFCKEQNWKVFLPRMEKILGEDDFSSFNRGYHHSTYIVILLTPCFKQDVWAVNRFQITLKKSIEERQSNVIPVLFGDSSVVPFELTAIAGIQFNDEFFDHVMKRTIKTGVRIESQKRYDEGLELQVAEVGQQSNAVSKLEEDSLDSGIISYAETFTLMSTESLPSQTSERYLNIRKFQELCMSLDITSDSLNDWRGLAGLLDFTSQQIQNMEHNSATKQGFSPSKKVLDIYFEHNRKLDKHSSHKKLNGLFREMNFGKGIQITQEALES